MLETKLQRIAARSVGCPEEKFGKLIPLFNLDNLRQCFHELKEGKASGIDRRTKEDYGLNLDHNLRELIQRMKSMSYRPEPVREILIPKDDGGHRPLGISVIEDKIIQRMYQRILEAIYEPHFLECSYGFRPGRSCHQALAQVLDYLWRERDAVIIDADLSNYFGSIDHGLLIELLGERIEDEVFLRYLSRILKAGVLSQQGFRRTDEGSPQGAICSPVLSNIYAHYALDLWIEKDVKPLIPGAEIIRYADDFVICCPDPQSAERIHKVLGKRLERFKLRLHPAKTHVVPMPRRKPSKGEPCRTFSFLGFTFYRGVSRKGYIVPKVKTDSKKFRAKILRVKNWLKARRNKDFNETWRHLNRRLEGHVRYYGVTFNHEHVRRFLDECRKLFFKWMNRRSQKRSMNWVKFKLYMRVFPPTQAKIYVNLLSTKPRCE